uniref:NADH-ubiquinone oxidoreductase chain 3 n=1 Tax=Ismarus sp. ZJUH_2016020 TaxID=2491162 RepID=A0A3S8V0U1_9HYME|nr:NADH dehydrogenase subunit 3 [Ismarus sp. ZJUH_2016020]
MIIILLMYLIILIIIFSMLMILNSILMKKSFKMYEKLTPFECGFDPISKQRIPFSLQFFLISIIFLIFDVEISIILPIILNFNILTFKKWIFSSLIIMIILLLGLCLEWKEGALKWFK